MTSMSRLNRYLLIFKYVSCYVLSLAFSAICFNISFMFIALGDIMPCLAASFMTYVFYTAAEACSILLEFLIGGE
jgi:hypothetical protein